MRVVMPERPTMRSEGLGFAQVMSAQPGEERGLEMEMVQAVMPSQ